MLLRERYWWAVLLRLTGAVLVLVLISPSLPLLPLGQCFCGMLARMHQLSDILKHSRAHQARVPHQAILGDLNTLANGVARLSPYYCCDRMRWWTLGWFEAEVWDQCVLQCKGECASSVGRGGSVGSVCTAVQG